jgi:hypothetical protein
MTQVVEHLSSKFKTLSSNPSTTHHTLTHTYTHTHTHKNPRTATCVTSGKLCNFSMSAFLFVENEKWDESNGHYIVRLIWLSTHQCLDQCLGCRKFWGHVRVHYRVRACCCLVFRFRNLNLVMKAVRSPLTC